MSVADDLAAKFDGSVEEHVHWRVRGPSSAPAPSGIYAVSYDSAEAAEDEARDRAPLAGVDIADCIVLEITEWIKITPLRKCGDSDD